MIWRWFREVTRLLRDILYELRRLNHRHPMWVKITFGDDCMASVTLNVGQSVVATVTVLDQFGNPFDFDFGATPPQWTISDPSNIGLQQGPNPADETLVGNGVSSATLTVSVAGVVNGSDTAQVAVVQAPPVATTVAINFGTPTP